MLNSFAAKYFVEMVIHFFFRIF